MSAVPDPRFRDQLAEALKAHTVVAFAGCDSMCACDRKWRTNIAYREHLAAEVEAHAQAAANQRAADELRAMACRVASDLGAGAYNPASAHVGHVVADLRARAAALASPAPVLDAEATP